MTCGLPGCWVTTDVSASTPPVVCITPHFWAFKKLKAVKSAEKPTSSKSLSATATPEKSLEPVVDSEDAFASTRPSPRSAPETKAATTSARAGSKSRA